MKFSRLSTIFFDDNDFQSKSPLDLPIIPRGEIFTIAEIAEEFNVTSLTNFPSMPTTLEIVNIRTSMRYTISNTATAPCIFTGLIPKTLRPDVYRAEFLVRGTKKATSAPFRVIAGNDWGCIMGNSPSERYSDGTASIIGGRLVKFVQYFMRKDLRLLPVESNTFYDDERGTSFSLQNKNFAKYHLEGYAGERTTAAISMLFAGEWSILRYYDGGGVQQFFRLWKTGDTSSEVVGRGFCQFAGDFNGRRQQYPSLTWEDALQYGIDFNSNQNSLVREYGSGTDNRVPTAVFCQPFTNIEIELKNGTIFNFDTTAHFSRITFTDGIIPDNFGRSLKRLNVDAIRQGDKVTRIGDNVNLANVNLSIAADFPSIHTIGKNVTLGNFDGSLRFSNNAVFDNLTIKATTPPAIFCKNAIFKNCKLKNYNIVGDVAELHNVELTTADFNNPQISPAALLVGCRFKYEAATYIFSAQRLENCRLVGKYDPTCKFDLLKFSGYFKNSFTYQRLKVDTNAATSTFTIDEKSLHGYIEDSGNYLMSIQRQDGRDIDLAGTQAVAFTNINGDIAFDYVKNGDQILNNAGEMYTRGTITSVHIGDNTPAELLSNCTFNNVSFSVRGDLNGNNLNDVASTTSVVTMPATLLLSWLQSGGSYLNNIDFTLVIDNDLPSGFSYLLFKTNPNILKNSTLTINVSNDATGELTARLRELYPNFNINTI